jgi:hypothetical protein
VRPAQALRLAVRASRQKTPALAQPAMVRVQPALAPARQEQVLEPRLALLRVQLAQAQPALASRPELVREQPALRQRAPTSLSVSLPAAPW